ncbi:MAG: hypothetical protein IPL26_20255 [Leptospiraceae bacterium]|nr:hypothetical protein [Leptospiraceae bacterium]
MQQISGLLVALVFIVFLSFFLAVGFISLICYSYFYFKYKSWKYFKRCYLFTLLGGCVGIFITYVLLPKTLNSQVIPYSILFACMLAGGFGGLMGKRIPTDGQR